MESFAVGGRKKAKYDRGCGQHNFPKRARNQAITNLVPSEDSFDVKGLSNRFRSGSHVGSVVQLVSRPVG